jgi:hypothetical protein
MTAPGTLRLSALLGVHVVDEAGRRLGVVHDVRAVQAGPVDAAYRAAFEVTHVVVGARGVRARLGLSPAHVHGPWPVRLLNRLSRETDLIAWSDVVEVADAHIVVRAGGVPTP